VRWTSAPTSEPEELRQRTATTRIGPTASSNATRRSKRNHEPGSRHSNLRGRNEVQEPHEGRWSRPRRTGPAVIETLRGGHRVSQHQAAKPVRGGAGKPVAVAAGRKPLERRSPREQRSGCGDLPVAVIRTSGGSKAREPSEDGRGNAWPHELTACGQDRAERSGPSLRRETLRRAEPQERARHETGPWRSREKKSAGRAREPWGRNTPGEASPVSSGFPRSQAL